MPRVLRDPAKRRKCEAGGRRKRGAGATILESIVDKKSTPGMAKSVPQTQAPSRRRATRARMENARAHGLMYHRCQDKAPGTPRRSATQRSNPRCRRARTASILHPLPNQNLASIRHPRATMECIDARNNA